MFKLDLMLETTEPCTFSFYNSLHVFDLYLRLQMYKKSKTCILIFLQISQSVLIKFSIPPQPDDLLKLMPNWFITSDIQGKEVKVHDLKKKI